MIFASYLSSGRTAWGAVDASAVTDLSASVAPTLREALESGTDPATWRAPKGAPTEPLDAVTLLPTVPDAGKVLCVGLNYADHIAEMHRATPDKPTLFTRFNDSLVGDGQSLIAPRASTRFDYEGEFAVVIGRAGRHVDPSEALRHVFGYTIVNDGSVRDYQRHTTQFTPGKNFPASGALGPWVVTADAFGAVGDQRITTRVNGVTVQDSSLDQLVFDVPTLIAYISEWTELRPGDIIATGTPGGVGDGRDPALYLSPGDVVDVTVTGIGTLTNPVTEEP